MDLIQILTTLLQDTPYVPVITAVVTLASAIAAITPTPNEGTVWSKFYKVLDLLALNTGRAKETGK